MNNNETSSFDQIKQPINIPASDTLIKKIQGKLEEVLLLGKSEAAEEASKQEISSQETVAINISNDLAYKFFGDNPTKLKRFSMIQKNEQIKQPLTMVGALSELDTMFA